MQDLQFIIEKSDITGLYVGYAPGVPGAHSQGATLEELNANLKDVLEMLQEDERGHSSGNARPMHNGREPSPN